MNYSQYLVFLRFSLLINGVVLSSSISSLSLLKAKVLFACELFIGRKKYETMIITEM
jgi:hypothetical protein